MSDPPFAFPRVQALPGIDRASFAIDGNERAAYEFGTGGPRPFVFPLIGASGRPLTRIGHPVPVGHEHHHSIWFGHQKLDGVNFWEERPGQDVQVRHRRVVAYRDGDWAGLLAEIDWWAEGHVRLKQELVVAVEPADSGGFALDLQSRFQCPGAAVELGQTNFGFLGVRVAKTLSEQFGGGRIRAADGKAGEPAIFGQRFRWVDYAGPSAAGKVEGIAYFDHPANPGHPTAWHVRRDGWFEAAFNLTSSYLIAPEHPLDLRYRLLVHGEAAPAEIDKAWEAFASRPPYRLVQVKGMGPTLELEKA